MRVNCVVTSFQVAAMGNAHLGLAVRVTRNLLRGICCLGGDLALAIHFQSMFQAIHLQI